MTDLERILSLANHGINKSPEARNTTKILKEAQEQINQLKESDAPEKTTKVSENIVHPAIVASTV